MKYPRVIDIVEGTAVDGPGLRTSIYFAGCAHHCEGCHNRQSWDFEAGHDMSVESILEVIDRNGFNVTFSGGDPMYQSDSLVELARAIKDRGLTLWIYTGFRYEDLVDAPDSRSELFRLADVVVDGPFILSLRDESLRFKGSSNQRIISTSDLTVIG
jgi:anaerobic ribonucleoside-triphosphate reductase activating protein